MAAHVASLLPTATQPFSHNDLHLGVAASMAAHVASLLPTATHVFGAAVPAFAHMSVPLLPVQSVSAAHSAHALPVQLGLAVSKAAHVASLLPMATQPFPDTKLHLGLATSIARHVASSAPTATHVIGAAVPALEHT
jgi:hypothetical protein